MVTCCVLGLDGGGTQTRAQTATPDGIVLGEGVGGPCNLAAVPVSEALQSVTTAAASALSPVGGCFADVTAVCAGVAGTSFGARRAEFTQGLQMLFPNAHIAVEPDYAIALIGATGGEAGVIVIAGTGSVAYGENAAGLSHKSGGYGYLLDDAGSGYGVGRAALVAVLRAADGTGEATALTERLLSALSLASLAEIIAGVYGGGISRVQIASLARDVALAAQEDDDAVARAILMRAGGALAQLVHGVTAALFPDTVKAFPVVSVGGLWGAGTLLTDVFARSVARFAPRAELRAPQEPPVSGAVRRALALR